MICISVLLHGENMVDNVIQKSKENPIKVKKGNFELKIVIDICVYQNYINEWFKLLIIRRRKIYHMERLCFITFTIIITNFHLSL